MVLQAQCLVYYSEDVGYVDHQKPPESGLNDRLPAVISVGMRRRHQYNLYPIVLLKLFTSNRVSNLQFLTF